MIIWVWQYSIIITRTKCINTKYDFRFSERCLFWWNIRFDWFRVKLTITLFKKLTNCFLYPIWTDAICLPLMSPPSNIVTSRLINLKFSGNATFYICFISQKKHFFEKVLWGCHGGMPLFRGRGRLRARLKFWCRFNVSR